MEPLADGRSNAMYRVAFDRFSDVVIRAYLRDPAAGAIELRALEAARGAVSIPRVIHAELDALPFPFIAYEFVPGVTFRAIKRSGDSRAVAAAAADIGATLARLSDVPFAGGTPLRGAAAILPDATADVVRHALACADSPVFAERIGAAACDAFIAAAEAWAPDLQAELRRATLVHGDFASTNIVLHANRQRLAVVIDWEFACAASPLVDLGHFLRYDDACRPQLEPHVARGFRSAGGVLPEGWRNLARMLDLMVVASGLAKADLPPEAHAELRSCLTSTLVACARPCGPRPTNSPIDAGRDHPAP